MARSATTRSQRAPKASQSQPRASQSRRGSRRHDPDDDEEQEEENEDEDEAEMDVDADLRGGGAGGDKDIMRKANDLVRLALFNEHKRTPLRREDISKKVLGSNARSFKVVFDHAQTILQRTFGMELVELRSRAELDKASEEANGGDENLNDARNATGMKKKAAAAGSKTFILRSTLDPVIVEYAALTDEQILEDEMADAPSDDDDDDMLGSRSYGSIISWTKCDQLGPIGILYVILALILVSGRVMSDMDLRANLKRLRLPLTADLSFNAQSTHKTLTVEAYLQTLIKEGYIDRQRIGENKKAKGGKRGRATQGDDESGTTFEWRWGNRAQSEVGETGIAKFVAEFMVGEGQADADDDDDDGPGSRAKHKKRQTDAQNRLAKTMKGIERAAGGTLADLK